MKFANSLRYAGVRGRRGVQGLGSLGQFDIMSEVPGSANVNVLPSEQVVGPVSTTSPSATSTTSPGSSGGFDWNSLLSNVASAAKVGIQALSTSKVANTQAEVQKAAIAAGATNPQLLTYNPNLYNPQYAAAYGSGLSSVPPTLIVLGGVGLLVAAFLFLKK